MIKSKIWLFVLLIIFACCKPASVNQNKWDLSDGYVPDSATAIKMAEIIFVRVYGEKVLEKKPFHAVLHDKTTWVIEGTLESGIDGGVPHMEIQKADGRIINLYHSK